MNIWNMTKKDLVVFFRDRGALTWLFVLPLVFIFIFAGLGGRAMSGDSASQEEKRTPLGVVNLDQSGATAQLFLKALDQAGGYRVVLYDQQNAEQLMNTAKLRRYLVIPPNFTPDLGQAKPVSLELIVHPNAGEQGTQSILQVINGVAHDTSLELQLLDGIRQMGEMQAANPQSEQIFQAEKVMAQAKAQFERSRGAPLIQVVQGLPQEPKEGELEQADLTQSMVPGITVLFVFLAAQTVARSIYEEKQAGSLRRLLAAPVRGWELMAGKLLPILILTLIQIVFIFAVGALLLPVLGIGRLGIGNDPLAWAVTSILMALCSTSLGILIAAIAKTEGQISGVSNVVLWVAGFLGGTLIPAFLLQQIPVLNFLSKLTPHFWASSAYYDILARGKGLADILPNLGILLGFAAVFFIIGQRRFRFE